MFLEVNHLWWSSWSLGIVETNCFVEFDQFSGGFIKGFEIDSVLLG